MPLGDGDTGLCVKLRKLRTRMNKLEFYSLAGAVSPSLASEGLSAESRISEVHNVKLSE